MAAARAMTVPLIAAVVSCTPSDDDFFQAVRRHIQSGPSAACCTGPGGQVDPGCAREAKTRCAFVDGANIELIHVNRVGHGYSATVEVELTGPAGAGWCRHQVTKDGPLRVEGGACAAGKGPWSAGGP